MMPQIFLFVSHVTEDRAAAQEIVDELERRGLRCWIAPRDVRPGRPYDDEIADAIEASRAMLLIFSEYCNASDYIRREVTVAGESHKVVIPFRIENVLPRHGLRVRLSDLHWIDGFASREQAIDELLKTFPAPTAETGAEAASGRAVDERASTRASVAKDAPVRSSNEAELKRPAELERVGRPDAGARRVWLRAEPAFVAALLIGVSALGALVVWFVRAPPTPIPIPPQNSAAPPSPQLSVYPPTPVATASPGAPSGMAVSALTSSLEQALKPGDTFKECGNCPEMIVVPAGTFRMGSPVSEPGRAANESPQHPVALAKPFAVGRFEVTFDEWGACLADGGCNGYMPDSSGWGRGRQPTINVSWDDAMAYVTWLAKKTGKPYRLLSEAEREYVTRAGTTTPFWWGKSISTSQANYNGAPFGKGLAGQDRARAVPVDLFAPNPWGLYQVHGNIYEWMQDCWVDSYDGAPADGSAQTGGDCSYRVIRGGSWDYEPKYLRSASRLGWDAKTRDSWLGFRVGRTLLAP